MNEIPAGGAYKNMIRFRTQGGVLTSAQLRACAVALVDLGLKDLHVTTRASIEFHHRGDEDAFELRRRMAAVGLGDQGACGTVVRGAAVSTPLALHAEDAVRLAGRIHAHFGGRGEFSSLPRKFKVGVDACYAGSRHLIQDAGFVRTGVSPEGEPVYDLYLAGGLGREPIEAFPFRSVVPESAAIDLLEAVVTVFKNYGEQRKRLKHLVMVKGRGWFCEKVEEQFSASLPGTPFNPSFRSMPSEGLRSHVLLPLFAGQSSAAFLSYAADLADGLCGGKALLTPDQDLALLPVREEDLGALVGAVDAVGLTRASADNYFALRVCPGAEHCPKALCGTAQLAGRLVDHLKTFGIKSAAISGCPNSCAQPQLADLGIICVRRVSRLDEKPQLLFDITERKSGGLGVTLVRNVAEEGLLSAITPR